jgi:hypothetical protein
MAAALVGVVGAALVAVVAADGAGVDVWIGGMLGCAALVDDELLHEVSTRAGMAISRAARVVFTGAICPLERAANQDGFGHELDPEARGHPIADLPSERQQLAC